MSKKFELPKDKHEQFRKDAHAYLDGTMSMKSFKIMYNISDGKIIKRLISELI